MKHDLYVRIKCIKRKFGHDGLFKLLIAGRDRGKNRVEWNILKLKSCRITGKKKNGKGKRTD